MPEQDALIHARLTAAVDDAPIDLDERWDSFHAPRTPPAPRHRLAAALVAIAIAAVGIAFAAQTFRRTEAFPGAGGEPEAILFERYAPDNGGESTQIWSVAVDGRGARPLPQPAGSNTKPEWSPDGTRIAFVNSVDGRSSLWVMNADGTDPIQVSGDLGVDQPAWSPDGRRIAFIGASPTGDYYEDFGIYVVTSTGGEPDLIVPGRHWEEPAWSPDGTQLVLVGWDGERDTWPLHVVGSDGSGLMRLTSDDLSYADPAWSPDGTRIAAARRTGNREPDVVVMDADGSNVRRLIAGEGWDSGPIWSHDGSEILFASEGDGPSPRFGAADLTIYVMDADGSNIRFVYDAGADIANPTSWLDVLAASPDAARASG